MSRFSAFAIHIGISFGIFLVLAYLVVTQWYPGIFFDTDGGWRGTRIIAAVDLVLGPLLTLVVFKSGKPGLRMDLSIIASVQLACLIAGTYVVYSERPLAVVYTDGRFQTMSQDDYIKDAGVAVPDLRHIPGDNPKWVMIEIPTDAKAPDQLTADPLNEGITPESEARTKMFKQGRLVSSLTDYYVPFSIDHPAFVDKATAPATIVETAGWQQVLDAWVDTNGRTLDDYAFYTFSTRYSFGYLVFDKRTYEILDFISKAAD